MPFSKDHLISKGFYTRPWFSRHGRIVMKDAEEEMFNKLLMKKKDALRSGAYYHFVGCGGSVGSAPETYKEVGWEKRAESYDTRCHYRIIRKDASTTKNYFINGNLHGLRFIAEKRRHWTERLLWVALCTASWYGSYLLIMASLYAFQNNAVSFVVETTYLHVNTSFPSVSVCEEDNMARVYETSHVLFGEDHDCNLDEVVKEITYFKGTAYYMKEFCLSGEIDCPKDNFTEMADLVRSPCEDIFTKCMWRGEEFDCCEHFLPSPTELGTCFTFSGANERYLMKRNRPYLSVESNRQSPLGVLYIGLNISSKVYLHSEADVPFYNTMTTDILTTAINSIRYYGISIIDIENGPGVRDLTVSQRRCRFPDENYLHSSDRYSYSACVVDCRRKEQLRICNCTSHLMPKSRPEERCGMEGVLCLNNNYGRLSVQKTKWGQKEGLLCDCLPGCNDPEYNVITVANQFLPENESVIEIFLDRLPSERYKRNVVRGRLDLAVSMGGSTGLFVGASLLSFAEIIYYLVFRSRDPEVEAGDKEGEPLPGKKLITAKEVPVSEGRRQKTPALNVVTVKHGPEAPHVSNYVISTSTKRIILPQKNSDFMQVYLP